MDKELKACPFCSCKDIGEVTINPRLEPHHRRFKVYCKACQCRTSEHKTRKEARIYWNTRAQLNRIMAAATPPDSLVVPVELLERVLGCIDAMGWDDLEADIRTLLEVKP